MKKPTPAIQERIRPQRMLTFNEVTRMINGQEETLAAPRVEGGARAPPRRPTPREDSSSAEPQEEAPPAWAVTMHHDMMMMGGGILHRMNDMHANMQTLRAAGGQDVSAWRDFAPYSELERRMVDMHLGAVPGVQDDEDDAMT
jgi:hypothetical protein